MRVRPSSRRDVLGAAEVEGEGAESLVFRIRLRRSVDADRASGQVQPEIHRVDP